MRGFVNAKQLQIMTEKTELVPNSLEGFDVSAAVDRMLGREDLWWEALCLFLQHFANWEAEWSAAQGDDMAERRCVHALRSAAANVGANQLSCAAAVLEELLMVRLAGKPVMIPLSVRGYLRDCWRTAHGAASQANYRYCLKLAG